MLIFWHCQFNKRLCDSPKTQPQVGKTPDLQQGNHEGCPYKDCPYEDCPYKDCPYKDCPNVGAGLVPAQKPLERRWGQFVKCQHNIVDNNDDFALGLDPF